MKISTGSIALGMTIVSVNDLAVYVIFPEIDAITKDMVATAAFSAITFFFSYFSYQIGKAQ